MRRAGRTVAVAVAAVFTLPGSAAAVPGAPPCSAGAACPPAQAKQLRANMPARSPSPAAARALRTRAQDASGTVLAPCDDPPGLLCGSIDVPLDREQPELGTTQVFFAVAPHSAPGPAEGTVMAAEGGPGGSSTASPLLDFVFAELLTTRDGLLVDRRGTGRSNPIDCPALQQETGQFEDAVRACGAQLDAAADAYGSRDFADDVDDVRAALGIDALDYYGLSWGGLEVQAYAARHGEHLRTALLDAPYLARYDDTFQRPALRSAVRDTQLLCRRSPGCSAADGHPLATLLGLLRRVRSAPVTGTAADADGNPHDVIVDDGAVADILLDPSAGYLGAAEISAATRALRHGDAKPLLRLAAEEQPPPGGFPAPPVREFSAGDNLASLCTDMAFPFDRTPPEATRRAQYDAAVAALPSWAFFPFSKEGWLRSFGAVGDACVPWPPAADRPPVPARGPLSGVPALVLSGDLDSQVPTENARRVAARFPNGQFVVAANRGHVTAPGDPCITGLVLEFVRTAERVDAACAADYTPFYAPSSFPRWAFEAALPPVDPAGGDASRSADRRVAAMAWAAAYDGLQRAFRMFGDQGVGLRGGTFSLSGTETTLDLSYDRVRFAADVAVSGTAHVDFETGAVAAELTVDGPFGRDGTLSVQGPLFPHVETRLPARGTLGGRAVAVLVPTA